MTDKEPMQSRFFIRMGGKGWMVYDRERMGPALIGTDMAANLTKERAEQLLRILMSPRAGGR
ncbi:hypothetical protein ACVIW2_001300 [Bradyrhizobium huanghuaihaiense]|nr:MULTISPECIES: hypothetical protein [Bradyrhizobium]UWU81102.1 hypothetical protein N2603_22325 [Bradyrhizobium sp. CB3035]